MEGQPTNQKTSRTEGLAQTCRANLDCRTGHRCLKSVPEELGGSKHPTAGSASLCKVEHCGVLVSLPPLCGPPTHTIAAAGAPGGLHQKPGIDIVSSGQ